MTRFKINWKALSTLRVKEEVSISDKGAYVNPKFRKPAFLIRLNADGSSYIYCRYLGDRDDRYREYLPDLVWNNCEVYPDDFFWVRGGKA